VSAVAYWPLASAESLREVPGADGAPARLAIRHARAGELATSYPAGARDRELAIEGAPGPAEVAEFTASVLAADPQCRRVVLPVPEQSLAAIAFAEEAGFRYVVDVETRAGAFSLLVSEPAWVLAQPQLLEQIPLTPHD
jgi:hypothetical protein